jgi:hypothetical protein
MFVPLKRVAQICLMSLLMAACGDGDDVPERPIGAPGMMDAGSWDAGPLDAHVSEAGARDASGAGNP